MSAQRLCGQIAWKWRQAWGTKSAVATFPPRRCDPECEISRQARSRSTNKGGESARGPLLTILRTLATRVLVGFDVSHVRPAFVWTNRLEICLLYTSDAADDM
eukprot:4318169-Prymnesium_polylepis.2